MQMIINCFIQIFMGAVSGYYTNKLAINHLFTDISLPGGTWYAVIKKGGNKERLAEDLSELAEDKIIGKESMQLENAESQNTYLYQELSKPEVLLALDQCVENIFQELEKSSAGQKALAEIFGDFLKKDQGLYELLEESLLTIAADWKLRDFISEEAFLGFFGELWEKELSSKLLGDYGLEPFLENICREIEVPITLGDVFGEDICKAIEEILWKKLEEILNAMEHDRERMKMEGYLHSVCRQLGIASIVREFLISLREKKLGEIVSIPGEDWFSEKLCFILKQPEIQKNLQQLFEILKKELVQADWKLSELLPEGCLESEAIMEILKEQMKKLQPFASSLYEDNQEFISERIAQELTAVIEEGTGNFLQNMILFSAKDLIVEKMQEFLKEKLPEKLQEFLEEPSQEFCMEISHAFGNLSVSNLIEKLSFTMVFDFLQKALQEKVDTKKYNNSRTFAGYLLEKAEQMPMSFFLTEDLIDSLSKKADKHFLLLISKWLEGEEKKKQSKQAVHFLLKVLWEKPLQKKEMEKIQKEIKKRSLPKKLFTWVNQWMTGQKETKADTGLKWIYEKCSEITIKEVFAYTMAGTEKGTKVEEKIETKEIKEIKIETKIEAAEKETLIEVIIGKYKEELTLGSIISAVPKEPLKKKIRELFIKNARNYLSIKPIVKKKILALDEDMLCTMMQKFMGTQLRPLNRIGGALGAIIGLFLWLLHPSLEISLPMVGLAITCYAMIGIGTNVLALHGLFRPYHPQERKWLRNFAGKDGTAKNPVMSIYHFLSKIPGIRNLFCLGYIPEKKDKIAGQLSSFVADNFLKPEDLLPEINITPEMVRSFLEDHKDTITEYAMKKLWEADWETLIRQAAGKMLAQERKEPAWIPWIKRELEHNGSSFLAKTMFTALQKRQEKTFGDYISSEQTAGVLTQFLLEQAVENLENLEDTENRKKLEGFLQDWYCMTLQEKTAGEFIFEEQEVIVQKAANAVCDVFYGDSVFLSVKELIVKAISTDDQRISELFGGKLGEAAEKNMDVLEMFFFRMLKQGCYQYLVSHEDALVDKLDLEIQNMMDTMASMPLGEMASSMLGTRQLIGKVFHNLFIEPPVRDISFYEESVQEPEDEKVSEEQSEEFYKKEEVIVQERLSDELFDKNETVLLEKIREIIRTQILTLTIAELREILFAAEEKEQEKEQWADYLCTKFAIWKQCRVQSLEPIQRLIETMLSLAGTYTIGDYLERVNHAFLEEIIWQKMAMEVCRTLQKPSMEQACFEYLQYLLDTYLLSERFAICFPAITESSFISMIQNNWKRLSCLPCVDVFLSELFRFDIIGLLEERESGLSILVEEFCSSLKEKESVRKGCQKFLEGGLEMISALCYTKPSEDGNIYVYDRKVIAELFDCIHNAFQYQRENQAGLFKVAETVDFANIIYLAVMDMTDAQIEALFKGFAGQYFLSLKLSGALGFVFGVPVVQWIAAVAALGSGLIENKKEE